MVSGTMGASLNDLPLLLKYEFFKKLLKNPYFSPPFFLSLNHWFGESEFFNKHQNLKKKPVSNEQNLYHS